MKQRIGIAGVGLMGHGIAPRVNYLATTIQRAHHHVTFFQYP